MSPGRSWRQYEVQIEVVLGVDRPDIALVDELARLRSSAGRLGWTIALSTDSPELVELVELAGLSDVISVEMRR